MEPKTLEIIASYSNMTEEEAKLLFIRKSATEAYANNEIAQATKTILVSICEISIVASMSKEEISSHIANLEKARSFLAAFTQGLVTAYQSELEPIFKAKHEKEKREKLANKTTSNKDKKVNELIEKARQLALNPLTGKLENPNKKVITKVTCEKCNKEVFSLKFHKC